MITNRHNLWLEILISFSVFISNGYIIFYVGIIRNIGETYRMKQTTEDKMICGAFLVSLAGFFFANINSCSIMSFKPHEILFAFTLIF